MTEYLKIRITDFSQEEVDALVTLVSRYLEEKGLFQFIGVEEED